MPRISQLGLLTCAGLYFAIGLCGVLFFGLQAKGIAGTDGYGVIHTAAPAYIARR
jgi:hypothetical protein